MFGANSPEHQSLFQSGWFVEGLLSQTLIVHMIRTQKIPFVQSTAAPPVLVLTGIVMAIGIFIPFSSLGASVGLQPLPISYFAVARRDAAWLLRAHPDHQDHLHSKVRQMALNLNITATAAYQAISGNTVAAMGQRGGGVCTAIDFRIPALHNLHRRIAVLVCRLASCVLRGAISLHQREHDLAVERPGRRVGDRTIGEIGLDAPVGSKA